MQRKLAKYKTILAEEVYVTSARLASTAVERADRQELACKIHPRQEPISGARQLVLNVNSTFCHWRCCTSMHRTTETRPP